MSLSQPPHLLRRNFLLSVGALTGVALASRVVRAGELSKLKPAPVELGRATHRCFARFAIRGVPIKTGGAQLRIGDDELARGEWIQCKRISYGLKRDIGTGARVSGHTHYDRIEFDSTGGPSYDTLTRTLKKDGHRNYTHIGFGCPQGPATPMLMQALERGHTVNATLRFYHNRRDGQEEKYMEIVCTDGRLAGVKVINQTRPDAEGTQTVEGEANMVIHYAFHQMQIDHVGEDGATSAHFDWSGMAQG